MGLEIALYLNIYSILILGLIIFNLYKKYGINNKVTKIFAAMMYVTIVMLLFDSLGRFDGLAKPYYIYFNKIGNTASFMLNPALVSLWMLFILEVVSISESKKNIIKYVLIFMFIISIVCSLLSLFATNDNFCFYINQDNIYMRGKRYYFTISYTGIVVLISSLIVLFNREKVDRRLFGSLFFFPIPPLIGVILQSIFYGTSLILPGVTILALLVYMHLQAIQMNTDYLTKIYNRRKLIFKLNDESRKARPGKTFSGILIDLVEFKHINDTYGHMFGDEILVRTAEILKKTIGPHNFLYRYGGDEFFIIISSPNEEDTIDYINRIKDEISKFNTIKDDKFKLELTCGHMIYDPIKKLSIEEFLEEIDQLMYNNKVYNMSKEK